MEHEQFNLQTITNLLWSLATAERGELAIWDGCMQQVGRGGSALQQPCEGSAVGRAAG